MRHDYDDSYFNSGSPDYAQDRASFHRRSGDINVFVAEVDISRFVAFCLRIQFLDQLVELEGLKDPWTSTMVFPMTELSTKFRIDFRIIQTSEWLALSSIPREFIHQMDP